MGFVDVLCVVGSLCLIIFQNEIKNIKKQTNICLLIFLHKNKNRLMIIFLIILFYASVEL